MLKNSKLFKGLYNWTLLIIIAVAAVLINTIGSYLYFRLDMTKDQRYSLAEGTEKFLNDNSKFESRISIQVYLEGNLPAEIQNFQNSLKDKLNDFKSIAGNRIEFNFINIIVILLPFVEV
jgi:cell division protein FtsX